MSAPDRLSAALADRYRIERELGAGGMATVYLAEDLKHHRRVALKVLRSELADALGPERFLREIETTAALHHPHILPLYDSGSAGDFLYYVMPFVEGESLRDRLTREKQLPIDDALQIAREVSDALSYAHSRGVIHRDIKPENIMLEGGHAMVADFGIARAVSAAGNDSLTRTGTSVGTPSYMSPEQAAGQQDLDGRSDLYALGCVVYEMLAGQPPFTGPTVENVVHQHMVAEARPITQFRPAVPPAIAGVLQRALAKNPADRFSPVAQFADALRTGSTTTTAPVAPSPTPRVRVGPLVAGALALGVLVVAAVLVMNRPRGADPGSGGPSVAVLPFVDLAGGANEYLADGIAETLINALSGVPGLRVAARTSAFSFKGKNQDVRTIGSALGVTSVLEGSVQRAGDQLRITAQLINASDGFHVWSQSFDRNVADVFAVQDEVARAVVSALQVKLGGGANDQVVEQGTKNLDAYNAYLQGLFHWNKRTTANMERAAAYFQQAIAADSGFASAWAGLALTYVLFIPSEYDVPGMSAVEALDRAEQAARKALALDERSVEAQTALAAALDHRGLIEESAREFRRAIDLDPRFPTARQWYAGVLAKTGETAEALAQMLTAQQLDPLSLVIGVETGEFLDAAGRRSDATAQYLTMLERYPDAYLVHLYAGFHFLADGQVERAAPLLGRLAVGLGAVGLGPPDSATGERIRRSILDPATRSRMLHTLAETNRIPDLSIAAYRGVGDNDSAIAVFERAVDGPLWDRLYVGHSVALLGPELSADPRIRAAITRYLARHRERQR
jgi:eukaryotic-like serine/threonine-protein kinase